MKSAGKNVYHKLPILDGLELLDARQHTLTFPFHTHNTFNITLVIEAIFATKLNTRLLHATPGTIVITNPGEVHSTICDNRVGSSFFTFYISPDVLTGLNNKLPVFFENKIINDPVLFEQLLYLSQNIKGAMPDFEQQLIEAVRVLVSKHASNTFNKSSHNKLFQKFLYEETFEKFSLENTAQKFGLDKYKFLRLFKYETGLTPNNYIILKRIEKCKELLQTHDDLLDIAIETGFYDATHLCKHFKKITGVTPLAYRKG
jgi:AraC-like DNA-binding protein